MTTPTMPLFDEMAVYRLARSRSHRHRCSGLRPLCWRSPSTATPARPGASPSSLRPPTTAMPSRLDVYELRCVDIALSDDMLACLDALALGQGRLAHPRARGRCARAARDPQSGAAMAERRLTAQLPPSQWQAIRREARR